MKENKAINTVKNRRVFVDLVRRRLRRKCYLIESRGELNLEARLINGHVFARFGQNFGEQIISTEGRGFSAGFPQ